MISLIVTFVLFGLSIAGLSIGLILGGRRFKGTCGVSACPDRNCCGTRTRSSNEPGDI